MPQPLALFPLQLVVYPNEVLNLHIFEARYRQLVRDVEEEGITFAVPTVIDGTIRPLATEVVLDEVARRYESGESDIRCRGRRLVRIRDFEPVSRSGPYPGGTVDFVEVDLAEDYQLNEEILRMVRAIYKSLDIEKEVPDNTPSFTVYELGHFIGLTLEQEYELLTLTEALDRQQFVREHLRNIRPTTRKAREMRDRAAFNGHFRELRPPNF